MPQCGSLFALVSIACLVGVIMASNEQFRPFDRSRERLLEHNSDDEQRLPTFDEVHVSMCCLYMKTNVFHLLGLDTVPAPTVGLDKILVRFSVVALSLS